eukprot:366071-Chlamydomonas_euryale.AAC.6
MLARPCRQACGHVCMARPSCMSVPAACMQYMPEGSRASTLMWHRDGVNCAQNNRRGRDQRPRHACFAQG